MKELTSEATANKVCKGGRVGIRAPAHWGLGEIDGLLVPPSPSICISSLGLNITLIVQLALNIFDLQFRYILIARIYPGMQN